VNGHAIRIRSQERELVAIDDFSIPEGKITFLFGESGIGKSLIAKALFGLLNYEDLAVTIDGHPYDAWLRLRETRVRRQTGFFVFQEPSSHLNPLMTLEEQLSEGSLRQGPPTLEVLGELWKQDRVEELRALLPIYPKPYRPSGGEKQRMLLGMAFKKIAQLSADGSSPSLFVFDEPTGSLDNEYRDTFLALLFARRRALPFTALVITHDYSMVSRILGQQKGGHVVMRELVLREGSLLCRDFKPETYTGWIKTLRPLVFDTGGDELLEVEGTLKIHGHDLQITQEEGGTRPARLVTRRGRLTYLKGPSGEGKTSFVKALMGLLPAEKLHAKVAGTEIEGHAPRALWRDVLWGKKVTMVFQHADEALNQNATVEGTLSALPGRRSRASVLDQVGNVFGLSDPRAFMRRRVGTLSGGQKQRLNLLRGLILDTDLLFLDEPLNALDFESGTRVIELLTEKLRQGKGILLISHNEEIFDALVEEEDVYYLERKN
jgi:peptide/nickel transport system ATP-binding protein